jgi:predicted ArsR family transcriptional regulator
VSAAYSAPVDASRIADLDDLAVLAEPIRRALYEYVVAQPEPVGRDAAATALGIGRPLAVFHLDRLVEAGLLETSFRRLSGRTGPGAGRPAKLYGRSPRELRISLPERRYDIAAGLFAQALEAAAGGGTPAWDAVDDAARRYGEDLGREARRRADGRRSRAQLIDAAMTVLREAGFEPRAGTGDRIVLRNCPFDALAKTHQDLVCGMNQSLMSGVIDGLRLTGITAELEPRPGMCCVIWRDAAAAGA